MKRVRVVVHGHVQGVGFRWSVRSEASRCELGGWVRNRPDGTLEAAFEGEPGAVGRLVSFCERGPRGAGVERVETHEEEPEGESGFEVR